MAGRYSRSDIVVQEGEVRRSQKGSQEPERDLQLQNDRRDAAATMTRQAPARAKFSPRIKEGGERSSRI